MSDKQITVSDLSALIAAREETRAELHDLALEAFEQWRSLEAKLRDLEQRFDRSCDVASEVRIRVRQACAANELSVSGKASGDV